MKVLEKSVTPKFWLQANSHGQKVNRTVHCGRALVGGFKEPGGLGHTSGIGGPGIQNPHLGLCHFLASEHEEDIPGMKQRKGQVQKGDILAQHIHRLKREHRAPWWGEGDGRSEESCFFP